MSLLATMVFLASLSSGMRLLEIAICIFVAIMSVALWVEMSFVGPDMPALLKGWGYGFVDTKRSDIFSLAGILGSVVMPHNLYLHTAAVQSKTHHIKQSPAVIEKAVKYCSIEPIMPIIVSFFVNMAVVSIAAESVYGSENASAVGLTDFCTYFQSLKGGCLLWAIALLAAGQSGAITTTYTGQYVMDGFLQIQLPIWLRSIITRLVAIIPSVIIAALYPDKLNHLVNIVNALLGILLPFAFTPLVKYNCTESIMGEGKASKGLEKGILFSFALIVWAVNATTLSMKGGGFFGEIIPDMPMSAEKVLWIILQLAIQVRVCIIDLACSFCRTLLTKTNSHSIYRSCGMHGGTSQLYLDQSVALSNQQAMQRMNMNQFQSLLNLTLSRMQRMNMNQFQSPLNLTLTRCLKKSVVRSLIIMHDKRINMWNNFRGGLVKHR